MLGGDCWARGGLSGDSDKRFRVRWCARKLVLGPRGQGEVEVSACWVGTVGQRGGLSGDSGRRSRIRWYARKFISGLRGQGQVGVCACWVGTVGQRGG